MGSDDPNITAETIEPLINEKTRAIVVVHYAGVACDMDAIMALAEKHHLLVVEDAAHSIDSYYKGAPAGQHRPSGSLLVPRDEEHQLW